MIPLFGKAISIESKIDSALSLLSKDKIACESLSLQILQEAKNTQNSFGLVKSNYILGYLKKSEGDYGKSVIYYLEGIRYAESAEYPEANKDLVNLLQNSGIIFKRFGNYSLAKEYYQKAMNVASLDEDIEKYTHLIYLTSMVLKEEGKYAEATALLESTFSNFNLISKKTIANIYNQIGLISIRANDWESAKINFDKLLDFVKNEEKLFKKYTTRAFHNLGNVYFDQGNYDDAIANYKMALELKHQFSHKSESIFITSKDIGESYLLAGNYDSAIHYLKIAETHYEQSKNTSNYYELFKFIGLVAKAQGNINLYTEYQDLYASSLENYLKEQQKVEATDKKYNLDLITQRYFALVAEQERNQQIQYYSAVGGSFLVTLIVLIIAFFQYRKYRLRKDLEASLKPYIKSAL
ncbi:MAG: tetratricopeptide repeat protein [Cytophagales bacterium]|nr:tetratricopeptide repeat protein [Cytophagales bacterium]